MTLKPIVGKHDFLAFCIDDQGKSIYIRYLIKEIMTFDDKLKFVKVT